MMRNSTKIYWTLISICSLMSSYSFAQRFQISGGVVYGSYAMSEVSAFQEEILIQVPVDAKVMSNFPNYFGFEGKLYYTFPRFSVGLYSSFHSTGSRISYADYSGSFEYNQNAKITQLGVGSEYYLNSNRDNPWQVFVSLQVGMGWTKFNIQDKMIVDDVVLFQDNLDFVSNHITIQPGIGVKRFFGKFYAEVQAGYLVDSSKSLEYSENEELKLLNNDGDPVSVDWSGFRLSAAAGIKF